MELFRNHMVPLIWVDSLTSFSLFVNVYDDCLFDLRVRLSAFNMDPTIVNVFQDTSRCISRTILKGKTSSSSR